MVDQKQKKKSLSIDIFLTSLLLVDIITISISDRNNYFIFHSFSTLVFLRPDLYFSPSLDNK